MSLFVPDAQIVENIEQNNDHLFAAWVWLLLQVIIAGLNKTAYSVCLPISSKIRVPRL